MTTPPAQPTSVSRYFLIAAAIGVAFYQSTRGNWFEVAGLAFRPVRSRYRTARFRAK
jgi:hypothetical protein